MFCSIDFFSQVCNPLSGFLLQDLLQARPRLV